MKELRTFGDWRKFHAKAGSLAYHSKSLKAKAFHAAINTVGRTMPLLPSRKLTDKLSEKELRNARSVVKLGIALGILPVKVPSTWRECLALFKRLETSECDIASGVVVQALWSELYFWYEHHSRFKRIKKAEKANMPLENIIKGFPRCVEASIRIWVDKNVIDPFEILDLETLYKP